MPTLSVILITCNEAHNLRRALESVKFADEIIVNDSGSTDGTLDIAREYRCKIIQSEFSGFGAAKQIALKQATGDWVLSIDADEEIEPSLQKAIRATVGTADFDGYYLNRKSQFLGRWITHSGWYPDPIIRLFRRNKAMFTPDKVHERAQVEGMVGRLEGDILHYTDPNIAHYLDKLNRYTSLSAGILSDSERAFHPLQLVVKPPAAFIKMYILKRGFLDGIPGLLLALLSSFHVLCKYAKLWELKQK